MKKYQCLLAPFLGCLLLTGAGCSKSADTSQTPNITRTYSTLAGETPSLADQRCNAILSLDEASRLTGVSMGKIASTSEDEANSAYSSVTCEYFPTDKTNYTDGMGFSITSSRTTLRKGSTFSAFRDKKAITLPNLGEDAYYSADSRGETNKGQSTGLTEILINDRIGIELNSSFNQQTAEKIARAIVKNFQASDYAKELSQRLAAYPAH